MSRFCVLWSDHRQRYESVKDGCFVRESPQHVLVLKLI